MLINALNDYYSILLKQGKALPDGYSNEKINYLIEINKHGKLCNISNHKVEVISAKGKVEEVARNVVLPKRTQKTTIDSNIIEHRPLYIFGLNSNKITFTTEDATNKATNSHKDFVAKNLEFIENLNSPIIDAYRLFIQNWSPENELENTVLQTIVKDYNTSKFIFCLEGRPDILLHKDTQILDKWENLYNSKETTGLLSQCAITGEKSNIARLHDKIKGVLGANPTGAGVISFNNPSDNSYNNEQSYNSNISERVMKRYTEALNYLLANKEHRTVIDDITVVHFAMSENTNNSQLIANSLGFTFSAEVDTKMGVSATEKYIDKMANYARLGTLTSSNIEGVCEIDTDVDYYMIGFKPNASRLSMKFIYRQKVGTILQNISQHQQDLKIDEEFKSISFWQLKSELVSPNSTKDTINPAMSAKIWESILYGTNYPGFLLQTVINRIKLDISSDKIVSINNRRVGIIKACINRKLRNAGKEEEFTLALNLENTNQAYLCGRLFAIYEKIQKDASSGNLNRTIKDSYFSIASSKPSSVFPKIAKLSHFHLKKLNDGTRIFYENLIGEIMNDINDSLPKILPPQEQGEFIVGYYQQNKFLYISKANKEEI